MKDIQVDKIVSYFSANNLKYEIKNGFLIYSEKDKDKQINIFYHLDSKGFYIDKKDYSGQPHVIEFWNVSNDANKLGLCLTLDGKDRRTSNFNTLNKIERIREIIFEKWNDPIAERFKELNIIFRTKKDNNYFIDQNNQVFLNSNCGNNIIKFEKIDIEYKGETFEDLCLDDKIKNKINENILLQINFNKETKKIFIPSKSINNFKLNDFTKDAFYARTGIGLLNNQKIILIGLGSIGGFVFDFLCKSGVSEIEFFDNDNMESINNPRHILGIGSNEIGVKKSFHMLSHYQKLFPFIKMSANDNNINYENFSIEENSIVINTTGGPIEKLISNQKKMINFNLNKTFIYIDAYIESFGAAVHLFLNKSNCNTNIDLINKNERYIVTNKRDFRINFDGCYVPTIPYSFAPLQVGVSILLIEIIKREFEIGHYTIPLLSLIKFDKNNLNEELLNTIDPYKLEVIKW